MRWGAVSSGGVARELACAACGGWVAGAAVVGGGGGRVGWAWGALARAAGSSARVVVRHGVSVGVVSVVQLLGARRAVRRYPRAPVLAARAPETAALYASRTASPELPKSAMMSPLHSTSAALVSAL